MLPSDDPGEAAPSGPPTFAEALRVWMRIGLLSFGGPAGQIALMHREIVEQRKWLDEKNFLPALNFCMLLPGPEAMQLATYVGWRLHGLAGGLVAGLLFVLPGSLIVLALAMSYAAFGNVPLVETLFLGIKAAVLAIVLEALLRISKRALQRPFDWGIAAAAFVGIFALGIPFPAIVLGAGLLGFVLAWTTMSRDMTPQVTPEANATWQQDPSAPTAWQSLTTTIVWLAIWLLPLLALSLLFPSLPVLSDIAWFFSKMAVVTFGGAYAVLAYVADEGVNRFGWLQPGEMLDGLGLAETTPGPLILVNAFVGYLAGVRGAGADAGLLMGMAGWAVTLWATFAPCFLWIFVGAPYVERINNEPRLKAALAAITAAVVGVILNLSVWFAVHVLFAQVSPTSLGPFTFEWPDLSSLLWLPAALSALAFVLLLRLRVGILSTLAICSGLALGSTLL